ncbi:hypothetical protein [Hymenobacter ruricola]|uniref:DUF2007 domain-containing protein n=1 Tax=Hymenobacter ruricola TaxID=2791023 RepID=A0ABS0I9I0_9BACT|nr:hypothetical protein [Hymenobacter ruricola]MBF9223595.1 hypothetical protein [Hymenobacter ruricola]
MLEFHKYQSFPSAEAAEPFLELLRQHNVPFETAVDTGEPVFNPAFTFNNTYATFVVKLHGPDFEWVRRLEEDASRELIATISPDHYLFKFTDAELFDILVNPHEWSNPDVILAGQLLRQRGRDVSVDAIRLMREHRVAEQKQPEPSATGLVRWGYGLALLGGVLSIIIGWNLYADKKLLSDGREVLAHTPQDRVHGLRIMALGTVCFLFWVWVRFVRGN